MSMMIAFQKMQHLTIFLGYERLKVDIQGQITQKGGDREALEMLNVEGRKGVLGGFN